MMVEAAYFPVAFGCNFVWSINLLDKQQIPLDWFWYVFESEKLQWCSGTGL